MLQPLLDGHFNKTFCSLNLPMEVELIDLNLLCGFHHVSNNKLPQSALA